MYASPQVQPSQPHTQSIMGGGGRPAGGPVGPPFYLQQQQQQQQLPRTAQHSYQLSAFPQQNYVPGGSNAAVTVGPVSSSSGPHPSVPAPAPAANHGRGSQSSRDSLHAYIYDYLYKSNLHQSAAAFLKEVPNATASASSLANGTVRPDSSSGSGSNKPAPTTAQLQKTRSATGKIAEDQQKPASPSQSTGSPYLFENYLMDQQRGSSTSDSTSRSKVAGSNSNNTKHQLGPSGAPHSGPGSLGDEGSSNLSDRSSGSSTTISRFSFPAPSSSATDPNGLEGDNGSTTSRSDGGAWSPLQRPRSSTAHFSGPDGPLPPPNVEQNSKQGHLLTWWSVYSDVFAAIKFHRGSQAARGYVAASAALHPSRAQEPRTVPVSQRYYPGLSVAGPPPQQSQQQPMQGYPGGPMAGAPRAGMPMVFNHQQQQQVQQQQLQQHQQQRQSGQPIHQMQQHSQQQPLQQRRDAAPPGGQSGGFMQPPPPPSQSGQQQQQQPQQRLSVQQMHQVHQSQQRAYLMHQQQALGQYRQAPSPAPSNGHQVAATPTATAHASPHIHPNGQTVQMQQQFNKAGAGPQVPQGRPQPQQQQQNDAQYALRQDCSPNWAPPSHTNTPQQHQQQLSSPAPPPQPPTPVQAATPRTPQSVGSQQSFQQQQQKHLYAQSQQQQQQQPGNSKQEAQQRGNPRKRAAPSDAGPVKEETPASKKRTTQPEAPSEGPEQRQPRTKVPPPPPSPAPPQQSSTPSTSQIPVEQSSGTRAPSFTMPASSNSPHGSEAFFGHSLGHHSMESFDLPTLQSSDIDLSLHLHLDPTLANTSDSYGADNDNDDIWQMFTNPDNSLTHPGPATEVA